MSLWVKMILLLCLKCPSREHLRLDLFLLVPCSIPQEPNRGRSCRKLSTNFVSSSPNIASTCIISCQSSRHCMHMMGQQRDQPYAGTFAHCYRSTQGRLHCPARPCCTWPFSHVLNPHVFSSKPNPAPRNGLDSMAQVPCPPVAARSRQIAAPVIVHPAEHLAGIVDGSSDQQPRTEPVAAIDELTLAKSMQYCWWNRRDVTISWSLVYADASRRIAAFNTPTCAMRW